MDSLRNQDDHGRRIVPATASHRRLAEDAAPDFAARRQGLTRD